MRLGKFSALWLAVSLLTTAALLAAGCGSGVGDPGGLDQSPATDDRTPTGPDPLAEDMGSVSFTVAWPAAEAGARVVPTATQKIVLEVRGSGGAVESTVTLTKTDVVNGVAHANASVRSGTGKVIVVQALDSLGQVVAEASQTVDIAKGVTTQLSLTLTATGITAPVVTATASGTYILSGEAVTLTGTATDPDGTIAKYEWDANGDGAYEFSSASTGVTTATLANGDHTATFRATDNDGLATTASVAFTVTDPFGPEITSAPTSVSAEGGAASEAFTVGYKLGFPVSPVTLSVTPATVTWTQTSSASDSFQGTLRHTDDNFDGTVPVTLTLTDGLGRTDAATVPFTVESGDDWTWIIYMAAANNLEDAAVDDINQLEAVTYPEGFNVLVLFDSSTGYGSYPAYNGTAKRFVIQHDTDTSQVTSPNTDIGTVDSGSAATLKAFVDWAVANHPANRYGVVLWDHGGGFRGDSRRPMKNICWDDDQGGNSISCDEMPGALASIATVDVFGMDACVMGMMEVAYEMRNKALFTVASEDNIPWEGYDYNDMFTRIVAHSSQSAAVIADDVVDAYAAYYTANGWGDESLSAIDASKLAALATAMDAFSDYAVANWDATMNTDWAAVHGAAHAFGDPEYKDLHHAMSIAETGLTDPAWAALATPVKNAVAAAVSSNWCGTSHAPNAHGLTFWSPDAPGAGDLAHYRDLDFAENTSWDEFLALLS